MAFYWRSQENFGELCDAIAGNRAFFLTGAGISTRLKRADVPNENLPGWYDLINALRREFATHLESANKRDLELLVFEGAQGRFLIEAASIIHRAVEARFPKERRFEKFVIDQTKPALGETSNAHREIAKIAERGIITFNYDMGHENAFAEMAPRGRWSRAGWKRIVPSATDVEKSEADIRELLAADPLEKVLIKAHGCISSRNSIVLTRESYRELMARRPSYRMLLTNIFLNYNVVSLGFGMDDPDYNELVETIYNSFGAGPRPHFLVTRGKRNKKENAYRAFLRKRYNIAEILCREWVDLPEVLADASRYCGPRTAALIDQCLSCGRAERHRAHEGLGQLSRVGAQIVSQELIERFNRSNLDEHIRSEVCFSLGTIRPRSLDIGSFLRKTIVTDAQVRFVALAILAYVDYIDKGDLKFLEERLLRERCEPLHASTYATYEDGRIVVYLEYLIARLKAKFGM